MFVLARPTAFFPRRATTLTPSRCPFTGCRPSRSVASLPRRRPSGGRWNTASGGANHSTARKFRISGPNLNLSRGTHGSTSSPQWRSLQADPLPGPGLRSRGNNSWYVPNYSDGFRDSGGRREVALRNIKGALPQASGAPVVSGCLGSDANCKVRCCRHGAAKRQLVRNHAEKVTEGPRCDHEKDEQRNARCIPGRRGTVA
jgi:hypothetical protein